MNESPDKQIANMEEDIALPRNNCQLVFESPWEGRAFGMAVALNENGEYEWSEFQSMPAAEIADAEQSNDSSTYYEHWLASLEKLLLLILDESSKLARSKSPSVPLCKGGCTRSPFLKWGYRGIYPKGSAYNWV